MHWQAVPDSAPISVGHLGALVTLQEEEVGDLIRSDVDLDLSN